MITRPDIARVASCLSEYLRKQGPVNLTAVDHCIQCLYGTKHLAIEYSGVNSGEEITTATPDVSEISIEVPFATGEALSQLGLAS